MFSFFKNKKIIVTGGSGFIGKYLVKQLIHYGAFTSLILRSNAKIETKIKNNKNVKIFYLDNDENSISNIFEEVNPEGVFHLATFFVADHNVRQIDELIISNINFGTKILEACKKYEVSWFVNTGTIWQNYLNANYNPVNLYSSLKQAFEDIAKYYVETSQLNFISLKLSDTYGKDDTRGKILSSLCELVNKKLDKNIFMSPGEQFLNFVYVDDVIIGLLKSAIRANESKLNFEVFSLLHHQDIKLKELIQIIEKIGAYKLNVNWGKRPYRIREVMKPNKSIEVLPGWSPKVDIVED